jgi:hypothetical protein
MIGYGAEGGFLSSHAGYSPDYDLFYKFIRRGVVLSLSATVFAIGGVWREWSVRWQVTASAVGTLAFWLLATTWP